MFEKLRRYLFEKALKKQQQKRRLKRTSLSIEEAKYIGILFDGTELDRREPILAYAKRLKKAGKRVKLLAFMDNTVDNSNHPFPSFNKKDIRWSYTPKSEEAQLFLEEPFDILLLLCLEPKPWMNYLAICSAARFRVGPAKAPAEACDLMLDMNKNNELKEFIHQAEQYLEKMQTTDELLPA